MNKKELIQKIKTEIKETSEVVRNNKKAFKHNQRCFNLCKMNDSKRLVVHPFILEKGIKPWYHKEDDKVYYHKKEEWVQNYNDISAKNHLTILHIMYNILRNNKNHCHNQERNDVYVKNFDKLIQGYFSKITEAEDAILP